MPSRLLKTPFLAAFFYAAIITACNSDQTASRSDYEKCAIASTAVASIQGDRPASSMQGQRVTVQGVATLVEAGQGLYIEEPESDQDSATSNAIFVQTSNMPAKLVAGTWISAQGTVTEIDKGRNSLTALTDVSELSLCSAGQSLPLTDVALPLSGLEREALEGMRIGLNETLTFTDTYGVSRGNASVSGNGFQFVATEIMPAGKKAVNHAQKNRKFSLPLALPIDGREHTLFFSGSTISDITGVMAHDNRDLRMTLQSIPVTEPATFAAPEQAVEGDIRVVGMNLLNFFNGDGQGGDFPTPRGAETPTEFNHQSQRISAAIRALNPHVLAVMELENDGFGPLSAAAEFINLAEQATGGSWQAARPAGDDIGSDQITVGIFYRDDLLEASDQARTLTGPEFERSRQPLAQVFTPLQGGDKVLVVVNHLKSKGSCPDSGNDANQKDGQGCWNPMRVASARKMSRWVNSLVSTTATPNALILGDMNAYRQEDPINTIRKAGFIELLDNSANATYSYVFFGQAGTLDYAFVNDALQQKVQQSLIWHINAALPPNTDLPEPWMRFSDHDPVVVDMRLRHSSTSD